MKEKIITVIAMIAVVALVLLCFYKVHESRNAVNVANMTEVEKLLEKDLSKNYPANPREVIKMYNRIQKAFYAEEYTDDELTELAHMIRELYDTELLKANPFDSYLENLKADINSYKSENRKIINTALQDYKDIEFTKKGDYNTATVISYYLTKSSSGNQSVNIKYYLREDEDGRWRILFFEVTDETV